MGFEIGSFCSKLRQNIQNYQTDDESDIQRLSSDKLDIGF